MKPTPRLAWLVVGVLATACAGKPASRDGSPPPAAPSSPETGAAKPPKASEEQVAALRSSELYEIYQADQGDRQTAEIDWSVVSERDRQRQQRVLAIVDAGEARTADDWFHAAMVMQHGESLDHYQRAHDWAMKATELDPSHGTARWLAAAAKDRWLMNQGKPQWYGTQFVKQDDRWVLYEVDPTITDEERARWNVPPLAEAREHAKAMNER